MSSIQNTLNSVHDKNFNNLSRDIDFLEGEVIEVSDTGVTAGNEFSVKHSLGRIPDHLDLLIWKDQTASDYIEVRPGGTAWTTTLIYLKCNIDNAALKIRLR